MKRAITLALFLFLSLYFQSVLYAQLSKIIAPNQNLFSIVQNANTYFDSLRTVLGDSVLEGEGSEFASYQRFFNFWAPRLSTHGDFEKYFNAFHASISNQSNFLQANLNQWQEIGPINKPAVCDPGCWPYGTCWASGLGPIEHLSVFKNNPQYMLCCQVRGGVFCSQNGGVSWSKTGTDTQVPLSGMSRAIFHPTDHTIWFTSSGGGTEAYPFFIMYTGGIWRASNEGASWTRIANHTNLGSIWNIIWELRIDPSNPDVLYAATEYGLYKTNNANSPSPIWTLIPSLASKKVYDLEFKPQNPQILYATIKDGPAWQFMVSTNAGQTWSTISGAPASVSSAEFLTIEVSNGAPDNLYCLIGGIGEVWIYNSSTSTWNYISTTNTSFGGGYNFAVNQVNGSEIFVGYGPDLKKMVVNGITTIIYSTYGCGNYHPDIEHLLCHPNNPNEVWMACHGGVYKSTDGGMTWNDRSNGLAVAEVLRMATAYTDPSHILIGTYHDGSMHTITPYSTNWTPNWKTVSAGDGLRPLIDNTDATYMWTSSQNGKWYFSQNAGASFSGLGCGIYTCLSTAWYTEGVLNKINPSILYREILVSNKPEIGRSFNRGIGNSNEKISNFAGIYTTTTYTYLPWKLYTPPNNGDYLLVHILVWNGVWYDHHLWRTKNANDPNPANVVWEELPLPYNAWFQDVEFDEDNPDIVYLAFGSSITSSNSSTGSQMIYKMDYTNPSAIPQYSCPSGLCTDLTLNLPNTGVGNDGLVLEKGSNGGMYVEQI